MSQSFPPRPGQPAADRPRKRIARTDGTPTGNTVITGRTPAGGPAVIH
ncbi:hypothetical protein ABT095_10175 [Kitasatospora sp. NPDC002227]